MNMDSQEVETKTKQALKKVSVKKNSRILVAISGGKDSLTVAYLLNKLGYNIECMFIDLCVDNYSKNCLEKIKEFCNELEIKLYVYDLEKEQGHGMSYFWKKNKELNHCAVCGVFKKWILNLEARRRGFDYIATGHNIDDEVETILLNVCKGSLKLGLSSGVLTKNISDKKFVPRIKPLYNLENKEIGKFAEKNKIKFMKGICPYREDSYRVEIRSFVEKLNKKQKENVLNNFEKIQKKFKQEKGKINYCEVCGEPTRGKMCKKCGLKK